MITATEFVARVPLLQPGCREAFIRELLLDGNVPLFCRTFRQFYYLGQSKDLAKHSVGLSVAPDYLCLGTDRDFLRIPVRPTTAQAVANQWACLLPTRYLAKQIWKAAAHLDPQPMLPGPWMASTKYYVTHNAKIEAQAARRGLVSGADFLAGHKKDIVVSPARPKDKIAIYGWHKADGTPIQGLYVRHGIDWVDYSHGARMVLDACTVDGVPTTLTALLADANLCRLVSDEGPVLSPRYPT